MHRIGLASLALFLPLTLAAITAGAEDKPTANATPPQGTKTLYVQVSTMNLREDANASAKVLKRVPIATVCQVLEEKKDGWAHLKCGDDQGYSKLELLGEAKPELAPLLEQAKAAKTAQDKLNFALRAATLVPANDEAHQLVKQSFFDAEFESLAQVRAKRKKNAAPLRVEKTSCASSTTPYACMEQLDRDDRPFRVVPKDNDLVMVYEIRNFAEWRVVSGKFSVAMRPGAQELTFKMENEYYSAPTPALFIALRGFAPKDPKPSWIDQTGDYGRPVDHDDLEALIKDCSVRRDDRCTSLDGSYFQNCSQDAKADPCEAPAERCGQECTNACDSARAGCVSKCDDCKSKCDSNPKKDDCVRTCAIAAHRCNVRASETVQTCGDDCLQSACGRGY
jgi:hypothetical protein